MAKLTADQKKMKNHKRGSSLGWPVCGAYIILEDRDRVIKVAWRGVTCKNCLRSKPKT